MGGGGDGGLILSRKPFVDPQEFLVFVHHADETAAIRVEGKSYWNQAIA